MPKKIIPIVDYRHAKSVPTIPTLMEEPNGLIGDAFGRPLQDLRISLTDRCNFRCVYCMPIESFGKDHVFMPRSSTMTFEEITRVAKIFIAHGVTKIRLTGGEPLLRKQVENLIEMLAQLKTYDNKNQLEQILFATSKQLTT